MDRFFGIFGIIFIFLIAFLMSNNKKAINYKTIGTGFLLQIFLALFVFKFPLGRALFMSLGMFIQKILDFAKEGGAFVFGPLINNTTISQEYYDNRWTPENQDAKYPRLSSQSNENNYQTNTLWLADRSFLKLRSIELYYKFPQIWVKKSKILSNAKIYVRGVDLLCFDKINIADPEVYGATYPLTRSVVAGLTIGF